MSTLELFDENTLSKIEQLSLIAREVRVGLMKGDRRSRKRGTSIEFADYRNYVKGDDLRRLDWNIYARLDRPFIKLLEEEEDLAVHVLVDGSGSMNWPPEVPENKALYSLRLAGALGYIGLVTGDFVSAALLTADGNRRWGPHRGRRNALSLLDFLQSHQATGTTNLNQSLRDYALASKRPGMLLLLSDLFSPAGYQEGINRLLARGYEVAIIQLLSPDEINPLPGGDLKLIDLETGDEAEITLDGAVAAEYRRRFGQWQEEIKAYCLNHQVHYLSTSTDFSWEKLLLQSMRAQRILA